MYVWICAEAARMCYTKTLEVPYRALVSVAIPLTFWSEIFLGIMGMVVNGMAFTQSYANLIGRYDPQDI